MSPSPVSALVDNLNVFDNLSVDNEFILRLQQDYDAKNIGALSEKIHLTVAKRNSSPPAECSLSPSLNESILNHITSQQLAAQLKANLLNHQNQHRKLDRSYSEPVRQQQSPVNQVTTGASRYKTELCRPFAETGKCKYSDKCQFAHGNEELRSMARHPKYKTELCRTFHTTGLCGYGTRCHFIHNEEERRNPGTPPSGSTPPVPTTPRSIGAQPLSFLQEEPPFSQSYTANFEIKPYTPTFNRSEFGPPPSPPHVSPTSNSEAFFAQALIKNELVGQLSPPLVLPSQLGGDLHQDETFISLDKYSVQPKVEYETFSKLEPVATKGEPRHDFRLPIFQNLTKV